MDRRSGALLTKGPRLEPPESGAKIAGSENMSGNGLKYAFGLKEEAKPDATHINDSKHAEYRGPTKSSNSNSTSEERLRVQIKKLRQSLTNKVFFFDATLDSECVERIRQALINLGNTVEPFYSEAVTHIITRRSLKLHYPANDVISKARARARARVDGEGVYNYDQLLNVLKYIKRYSRYTAASSLTGLGGSGSGANGSTGGDASGSRAGSTHGVQGSFTLGHPHHYHGHGHGASLVESMEREKFSRLMGTAGGDTRSPAKFKRFEGPYCLVWDPKQKYRPLAKKEYNIEEESWPRLALDKRGWSAFEEPKTAKKTEKRRRDEEQEQKQPGNEPPAAKLIKVNDEPNQAVVGKVVDNPTPEPVAEADAPVFEASGVASLKQSTTNAFPLTATIINTSTTSQNRNVFTSTSNTGSAPSVRPSRDLLQLHKKIITRPLAKATASPSVTTLTQENDTPAGKSREQEKEKRRPNEQKKKVVCENCNVVVDDFEHHRRKDKRHLRYINDPLRFQQLDALIKSVKRQPID